MLPNFNTRNAFCQKYAPFLFLVGTVLLAYGNIYGNDFLFDDFTLIVNNQFFSSWDNVGLIFTKSIGSGGGDNSTLYRPLGIFLFFLVCQATGPSLFALHALSVIFHAANACLVFVLGKKLRFNPTAAFLAALVWAVHPLHTEAVSYISNIFELLYFFFCLWGIVILLPDFSPRKMLWASICFILALLSKETSVLFPLLAATCLFAVSPERMKLRTYLKLWPFIVITALFMLWRVDILGINAVSIKVVQDVYAQSILCRFYTFLATLPAFAALLVWPHDLYMDRLFYAHIHWYDRPVLIGGAIFLGAIGFLYWARGQRALVLSWSVLWSGAAYLLFSGVAIPINFLFSEHWMYVPSAGLFLGIAQTATTVGKRLHLQAFRREAITFVCCYAILLGIGTYLQNRVWNNPDAFYQNILKHNPDSALALDAYGALYIRRGDYDGGIAMIRHALAIGSQSPTLHNNLAVALMRSPSAPQHIDEIQHEFETALALNPNYYLAYFGLSDLYTNLGDAEKARDYHDKGNDVRIKLLLPPE